MANKQYLVPGLGIYNDSASSQYMIPGYGILMGGPRAISCDAGACTISAGSDPGFLKGRRIKCNFSSATTTLWSEDCTDITDWYNCGNGGLSYSESVILGMSPDPSDVFTFKGILGGIVPPPAYNVGATACRSVWWPISPPVNFADTPPSYTFNIVLYHAYGSLYSGRGNLGKFQAILSNGEFALDIAWGDDGLTIGGGIGEYTLIPGIVLEGYKQYWSFEVTGHSPTFATVKVRLGGVLVASDVDCSWVSTTAYDSLVLEQHPPPVPAVPHKSQIISTTYVDSLDITYEVETLGTEQDFNITGTAADLIKIPLLSVDSGSYLINPGEPADLKREYPPLVPDAGSYLITGEDITLPRGVFADAESDFLTITGTDASFGRTCLLDATGTSSMVITGVDVDLRRTIIFSCETNSFTVTGTNADLTVRPTLPAEPASYIITTMDTTVFGHGAFVPYAIINSDPFRMDIITEIPADLRAGFQFVPDAASILISGQDLTAYRQFMVPIGDGAFFITSGDDISFLMPDHVIAADEGPYIIREDPNQELTFRWGYATVPVAEVIRTETRPVGMTVRKATNPMAARDHTAMTQRSGNIGFLSARIIPNAEG